MISNIITSLASFSIILGLFFIVSSVIGLTRFSNFYAKIHAAGVADSLGIPLTLIGFAMIDGSSITTLKLIILVGLIYLLTPTSTHTLLRTAFYSNYQISTFCDQTNRHNNGKLNDN